jgi:UDP-N-acetylmuramoyl-tripeptide--D-alanyl-D-alanine ligase
MKISELHQLFLNSTGISTDTRAIKPNSIFFALKGEWFDGNKFAKKAIELGCKFVVVDDEAFSNVENSILVDSVLITLQKLANYHRKTFSIPVIGITGSNGKTTTKELITAVLAEKYKVHYTKGNLNNHLGVPFTLLELNDSHEIAVIEMGANKLGDIKELVEIAEPNFGIITNIGKAHIEGFGSHQGVIDTKTEMYDFIAQSNGEIFYNANDPILVEYLPEVKTHSYGENKADITGEIVSLTPFVNFKWQNNSKKSDVIKSNLVGHYNFINFLTAVSIGDYFEVSNSQIKHAIENYKPSNNRSQVEKTERNTLVVDCYNANPTSMKAAIDSFMMIDAPNKLLVIGDMLELGHISNEEHFRIVNLVVENKLNTILIGELFGKVNLGLKHYDSVDDMINAEKVSELNGNLILLKGSRGIKLEKLIELL